VSARQAHDLAELLELAGVETLSDLSVLVDDQADLDAWVPALDHQPCLPGGLLVVVSSMGAVLEFPATVAALFELVDELQDDVAERLELLA
jgi:hypothetical protein